MKWVLIVLVLIVLAVLTAAIFIRSRPVPQSALDFPQVTQGAGDDTRQSGFTAVRTPDDPEAAVLRLLDAARDTPRTDIVLNEPYRFVAVTRSLVMGFPDVAHVWADGDRVIATSSLVMGKYDFGKNQERMRGWLEAAQL
ncbi:DUF1499 domain-containing protein [Palleronia pelagia]|uniref:DUF1499 domain-containing protein n=1 Tax=Palleronia pelagia TaxID=387096 RepID=A0A1H8B2Q2_9RHOB|nr:DUF1499 domain-containing protein [Palleronia pelagia]SEM76067.1 Protein of unknown function [Palleronia pelagia]